MPEQAELELEAVNPSESAAQDPESVDSTVSTDEPAGEPQPGPTREDLDALRVRLEALQSDLAERNQEVAHLKGRLDARSEPPAPKPLSRQQLQKLVDEGGLTDAERDEIIAKQEREKITSDLRAEMDARDARNARLGKIQSIIDSYRESIPALLNRSSAEFLRARQSYQELVEIDGPPKSVEDDLAYEAKAMRMAFGNPKQKPKETTKRETHQETGGVAAAAKSRDDRWEKGLSQSRIEYYREAFRKKIYSGPEDPAFKEELKYARAS